jgi:hypothetical protein
MYVKIDVEEVDRIVAQVIRTALEAGDYKHWGDSEQIKKGLIIAHNWYCIPEETIIEEDFE